MRPITDYLSTLTVPGGDHAGGPFVVLPWERRFINGAFAVPGDCAIVYRARKWEKRACRWHRHGIR